MFCQDGKFIFLYLAVDITVIVIYNTVNTDITIIAEIPVTA